ncbi:MAG: hypothetical protein ACI9EF_002795 [Pseudohongiellaceae bacterium]
MPNSNPLTNSYFANGMLPNPLPNLNAYPGPDAPTATQFYGYGLPDQASGPPGTDCLLPETLSGSQQPGITQLHPNNLGPPSGYGDNARYFMMWKYAKRISRVQSPAVAAHAPNGWVRWQRPIVSPSPADLARAGDLRLEIKTSSQINFAEQPLHSGYIDSASPAFIDALNNTGEQRPYVKFRATFGVAPGRSQPPSLETVVLPFEKLRP